MRYHSPQHAMNTRIITLALVGLLAAALFVSVVASEATAQPAAADRQTMLGPGLYVFQTRILTATCGDADRTGYVTTYLATIDGIPGERSMSMVLVNSDYWKMWALTVTPAMHVVGSSEQARIHGTNGFDVSLHGDQLTGQGTRTYQMGERHCSVSFDALLRRVDR